MDFSPLTINLDKQLPMQICLVPLHLLPKKGKIKNGLNINGDEAFRGQVPSFCIFEDNR